MAQYLSFGEIMLRLKTPGHERFFQSPGPGLRAVAYFDFVFDAVGF